MKRLLHALAALWPKKRTTGSPPLGDPGTAIPQHLAAVLRMEGILGECADLRICKSANETLGAGALNTVRDQLTESSAQQLTESPDTRLPESSAQQLNESPDTRLIESPDTRLTESPDTRLVDSPNQQIAESPNQPQSLPRIPQPMPLLTILMLVFFMCLMAAKQVSAQAEPADAAVITQHTREIHGRVRSGESGIYLQGAEVRDKGSRTVATTDSIGNFTLISTAQYDTLYVSYAGYMQRSVPFPTDLTQSLKIVLQLDTANIQPLTVGDRVPDFLWNLPLYILEYGEQESVRSLNDFRDSKLIVIDFWSSWCSPCVRSVDFWHQIHAKGLEGLQILTVHMDYDYKVRPFLKRRQWTLPTVYGPGYDVLNRHFFNKYQVGGIVWIADGHIKAIYYDVPDNKDRVEMLLRGEDVTIVSTNKNTYSNVKGGEGDL